jgi:amino acid transporter
VPVAALRQRAFIVAVTAGSTNKSGNSAGLQRRINLPLLVLYGIGVTVGAGIYVLIGAMAGRAGLHAPLAFLLAAIVMAFTAASYAELCTRFPVSAGEAAYVRAAFGSRALSRAIGLLTAVIGIISSAAVALGSAGYLAEFIDMPRIVLACAVVILLGAVSAWGILESVALAALFTVIEVGGLVLVIVAGLGSGLDFVSALPRMVTPPADVAIWSGIAFASLLAFFAFIGFEDLVNISEEAHAPERDLPRAIALTLGISTLLYVLVAAIAVTAVPPERLAASQAPLSLVFREVAGMNPAAISAIAIIATLNTILVQVTMASRVLYGMARQGDLPAALGQVAALTSTPLYATALVIVTALIMTVSVPLEPLAEATSLATLLVFAMVNLALLKIRLDERRAPRKGLRLPLWVPLGGLLTCLAMIAAAAL